MGYHSLEGDCRGKVDCSSARVPSDTSKSSNNGTKGKLVGQKREILPLRTVHHLQELCIKSGGYLKRGCTPIPAEQTNLALKPAMMR